MILISTIMKFFGFIPVGFFVWIYSLQIQKLVAFNPKHQLIVLRDVILLGHIRRQELKATVFKFAWLNLNKKSFRDYNLHI